VTGASSGIGAATARLLASQGHSVFLASRSFEKLEEIAAEINNNGGRAVAVKLDLEDKNSIEKCAQQVIRCAAAPFVLINNAGYGIYGRVESVPLPEARRMFEINFFGALYLTNSLLPLLKKNPPGRVINVSSGVAKRGFPIMSYYAASKAALESISESMRLELEPYGIVVQIVYPLRTGTAFSSAAVRYVPDGFKFPEHGPTQTATAVARAINRGLNSKRIRIHPHYSTKLLGVLNEFFPELTAKILSLRETVRRSFESLPPR
ncbi:MAG: SDR family NAD(P)-dependent oxidoreductase, partial [bacterium]